MDRTYITQQNKTPVFQLGLELWKQHVVHHPVISRRMLNILLDLINKERSGEVIDRGLVRSTTQVRGEHGHMYLFYQDFQQIGGVYDVF